MRSLNINCVSKKIMKVGGFRKNEHTHTHTSLNEHISQDVNSCERNRFLCLQFVFLTAEIVKNFYCIYPPRSASDKFIAPPLTKPHSARMSFAFYIAFVCFSRFKWFFVFFEMRANTID